MISEPNRSACYRFTEEQAPALLLAPGSSNNHQAWPGGWLDHVVEAMNLFYADWHEMNDRRPLAFTIEDGLLVMFLHDFEKLFKYNYLPDGTREIKEELRTKEAQHAYRQAMFRKYDFKLSSEQLNALKYVEGELTGYSTKHRAMGELAALCHCADIKSARLFHNYPLPENDPWAGARRHSL